MTPEQLDLARRLVAHPKWAWREGMRAAHLEREDWAVRLVVEDADGRWWAEGVGPAGPPSGRTGSKWRRLRAGAPDLMDAATAGCILEMLDNGTPKAVHVSSLADGWEVNVSGFLFPGNSCLGEACARVLLATWEAE